MEATSNKQHSFKIGENIFTLRVEKNNNILKRKKLEDIRFVVEHEDGYYSLDINLGSEWIFFFSELVNLYNSIGKIDLFSHQWKLDGFVFRLTHKAGQNTLLLIKREKEHSGLNIVIDETNYFSFIGKIIDVVQDTNNFRFSIYNSENSKRNLSFAKINEKNGTIITTFGGIVFNKPHLSESDKYQLKYSAVHRLLFGRWLTVHTERVNISSDGIITTVDEEYILDTNEKNKSTFVALVILASLSFKE